MSTARVRAASWAAVPEGWGGRADAEETLKAALRIDAAAAEHALHLQSAGVTHAPPEHVEPESPATSSSKRSSRSPSPPLGTRSTPASSSPPATRPAERAATAREPPQRPMNVYANEPTRAQVERARIIEHNRLAAEEVIAERRRREHERQLRQQLRHERASHASVRSRSVTIRGVEATADEERYSKAAIATQMREAFAHRLREAAAEEERFLAQQAAVTQRVSAQRKSMHAAREACAASKLQESAGLIQSRLKLCVEAADEERARSVARRQRVDELRQGKLRARASAAALQEEKARAAQQMQEQQRRNTALADSLRERLRERNLARNLSTKQSHKAQIEAARVEKLRAERERLEKNRQLAALALEAVRAEEAGRRARLHDRVVKSKYVRV